MYIRRDTAIHYLQAIQCTYTLHHCLPLQQKKVLLFYGAITGKGIFLKEDYINFLIGNSRSHNSTARPGAETGPDANDKLGQEKPANLIKLNSFSSGSRSRATK